MKSLHIRHILAEAWDLTRDNFAFWIRLCVIGWGISFTSSYISSARQIIPMTDVLVLDATWFALFILSTLIRIGTLKLTLRVYNGETPEVSDILSYQKLFLRFIGVSIVMFLASTLIVGIPTLIAFVLSIFLHSKIALGIMAIGVISLIYFMLTYGFAYLFVVDEEGKVWDAFKKSAKATKNHKSRLFLFYLALIGINILGAICFGIGLLVSVPLSLIATVIAYRTLKAKHHSSLQ